MPELEYENFVRLRITQLRLEKNISEHKMSLELGRNGSYIRGITSGSSLPSLRELFNIIAYFELTPPQFFAPLAGDTPYCKLCERLRALDGPELEKINLFVDWIQK